MLYLSVNLPRLIKCWHLPYLEYICCSQTHLRTTAWAVTNHFGCSVVGQQSVCDSVRAG